MAYPDARRLLLPGLEASASLEEGRGGHGRSSAQSGVMAARRHLADMGRNGPHRRSADGAGALETAIASLEIAPQA
jgi:hypothetical protein